MMNPTYKILTGQTQEHLSKIDEINRFFHQDILSDFLKLKESAAQDDINIFVLSSFRSFNDQLSIWNKKARGERTLLDDNHEPLVFKDLSPTEIVFAILRWSALPGASRHHWGTDFDIVDKNTWPQGHEVQLIESEFVSGGPFEKLNLWLEEKINDQSFHFYRPYEIDHGGIGAEKWHLSHKHADKLDSKYTMDIFNKLLDEQDASEFALIDIVRDHREEIFERFVKNNLK
jgi:LAS superfamily LD-carboxypeptidase LdcB